MTSKILQFEKNWGEPLRWVTTIVFSLLWVSFWLYADARYETHTDAGKYKTEFSSQINLIDTSSNARDDKLEQKLDSQRNEVIQMGRNIERLIAQNEIILQQLRQSKGFNNER